nr:hypothetical protein [Streptomyces sp. AC495_CC817]
MVVADLLPASGALKSEVAHQPGDGAAGHRYAFAVQLPPHIPDSADLAVCVDARYERFDGRSNSAAKKAEAAFKISFTCRSSVFSARSRLISAASSEVIPGRWPASTSALRTQVRTVSAAPIPSLAATAFVAAHSVG